ncbi:hypothetical protein SAMN05428981_1011735 [Bacillus sp. OV194]|nr:hypothetical protein SAMN05428981_1011735 [Bacillus sp. OV194]
MKRLIDFVWEGLTLQHMPLSRFMILYIVHYVLLFLFSVTLFILSFGALLLYKSLHTIPPFGVWAGIMVSATAVFCIFIIGIATVKRMKKQVTT